MTKEPSLLHDEQSDCGYCQPGSYFNAVDKRCKNLHFDPGSFVALQGIVQGIGNANLAKKAGFQAEQMPLGVLLPRMF